MITNEEIEKAAEDYAIGQAESDVRPDKPKINVAIDAFLAGVNWWKSQTEVNKSVIGDVSKSVCVENREYCSIRENYGCNGCGLNDS